MSEDKKPKKDLRARLGRTIAPNTPGAPPIAAPGGVIAPPSAAPATPTAAAPGPAAAVPAAAAAPPAAKAQPAIAAPPVMAPARNAFGGADIAPPPFAKPAEPPPPEAPKARRPVDPFALAPASHGPQEMRLIIDEKPLEDAGAAARRRNRNIVVVVLSIAAGLVLGGFGGAINGQHNVYNTSVRDGHEVHDVVETARHVVDEANTHLEAIAASAQGTGADHHPTVNYDEIAALTALENPVHAGAFARKNYNLFPSEIVDDLFEYDRHVQALWAHFVRITSITTGPARRATLDTTAAASTCPGDLGHDDTSALAALAAARAATSDAANSQYVVLLGTTDDGTVQGTLGFREADFDATTHEPTGRPFMRAGRTGPGRAFDFWSPGATISGTGSHLIAIDGPASASILGERAGAFRTFAAELSETRELMHETLEIQQRVVAALEQIGATPEAFAF
jgi:hypothetical protein